MQLTDAIEKLVVAEKPVIGVKLRSDELRLDLGSPETIIEALKLSLMHADAEGKERPETGSTGVSEIESGSSRINLSSEDSGLKYPPLAQLIPVRKKTASSKDFHEAS